MTNPPPGESTTLLSLAASANSVPSSRFLMKTLNRFQGTSLATGLPDGVT